MTAKFTGSLPYRSTPIRVEGGSMKCRYCRNDQHERCTGLRCLCRETPRCEQNARLVGERGGGPDAAA